MKWLDYVPWAFPLKKRVLPGSKAFKEDYILWLNTFLCWPFFGPCALFPTNKKTLLTTLQSIIMRYWTSLPTSHRKHMPLHFDCKPLTAQKDFHPPHKLLEPEPTAHYRCCLENRAILVQMSHKQSWKQRVGHVGLFRVHRIFFAAQSLSKIQLHLNLSLVS